MITLNLQTRIQSYSFRKVDHLQLNGVNANNIHSMVKWNWNLFPKVSNLVLLVISSNNRVPARSSNVNIIRLEVGTCSYAKLGRRMTKTSIMILFHNNYFLINIPFWICHVNKILNTYPISMSNHFHDLSLHLYWL